MQQKRTVRLFAFVAAFALAGSVAYGREASGHPDAGTKPKAALDNLVILPDPGDMKDLAQQAALLGKYPNDEKIFYMTTQYLRRQHKFIECQQISEKYAKDHPSWAAPFVALGTVAKDQGDDDAELAYYKRALTANPNCLTAIIKYADLLRAETRYKESNEYAERGLRLLHAPSDDLNLEQKFLRNLFLSCKGRDLLELNDLNGAITCLGEVHRAWPREEVTTNELANALISDKKGQKAIDLCSEGLRLNPNFRRLYYIRAQAQMILNHNQEAIDDLSLYLKKLAVAEPLAQGIYEALRLRATLYDRTDNKKLADQDRAILKNGSGKAYEETFFRTKEGP